MRDAVNSCVLQPEMRDVENQRKIQVSPQFSTQTFSALEISLYSRTIDQIGNRVSDVFDLGVRYVILKDTHIRQVKASPTHGLLQGDNWSENSCHKSDNWQSGRVTGWKISNLRVVHQAKETFTYDIPKCFKLCIEEIKIAKCPVSPKDHEGVGLQQTVCPYGLKIIQNIRYFFSKT